MNKEDSFIKLENVSRWFEGPAGKFNALKNVSVEIRKGQYTAIVGKSGSGKSTMLNMLTGIDHPNEGRVCIDMTYLNDLNESRLAKWRGANVGIVFQFFQLIPTLTVLENILIAMDFVDKIPLKDRHQRAMNLLEQTGISEHAGKLPAAISGGQQQRAAIARALANDPPVIVADEPTGNLDVKTSQAVSSIFADLVKEGKTVVVVTHDNVDSMNFSRVISLSDGEIISDKNMREG